MIRSGDRLDVVLDVYTEPDSYRVVLVGVFQHDCLSLAPIPGPGAIRNVVQSWLDMPHHARAFQLEIGPSP